MMVLNRELNICQEKSEICLLKYLNKEDLKIKDPALTANSCPSLANEIQVDACIFSTVKKMDEKFVQTTEKKAKSGKRGCRSWLQRSHRMKFN